MMMAHVTGLGKPELAAGGDPAGPGPVRHYSMLLYMAALAAFRNTTLLTLEVMFVCSVYMAYYIVRICFCFYIVRIC
jgi:hypothetical protein